MTKMLTTAMAAMLAIALPVFAQNNGTRPLRDAELLRTLDSLGTGDPTTKAPLSLGDSEDDAESLRKAPDGESSKKGKGSTEITAREASFDQKTHQAVFGGDVKVVNPEFNINCDKLTAFLKNNENKGNGAAPPRPPAEKKGPSTGGLEKAIAEGSVVITQDKVDSEGKPTRNVGRSKRAVYDAASGDVTLTGRPEVQQGINTIVALDESTVMVLNREGRMKVTGPHKTVIKDAPENPNNGR
jgi:lipopolysaccharide export system protein LptA